MNSQDVINYVLNSPHNTNPAVLRTMLNAMDNEQDCVQVQADWNQNDPTAPGYVKNRPFYEGKVEGESTITIKPGDIVGAYNTERIWEQRQTAKYWSDGFDPSLQYWFDVDETQYKLYDGKNVVIVTRSDDNIDFSLNDEMIAVEVTCNSLVKVHKLDAKYLPYKLQPDGNQNDPIANDYIKNRPFYENIISTVLIEANATENNLLPQTNFMFDKEYIIEFDGVRYPLRLTWQWDFNDGGYFVGFNVGSETAYGRPYKADSNIPFILSNYSFQNNFSGEISLNLRLFEPRDKYYHTIKIMEEKSEIKILDAKYLPNQTPYVIDSEAYTYGDDALAAILEGRQVLVKVPNKDGRTIYSNFMPVLQYQLPNENNNYLTLFYLKDGIAENILAAMQGAIQGDPSGLANLYGTIEMMLSQSYAECPLKVSPIK